MESVTVLCHLLLGKTLTGAPRNLADTISDTTRSSATRIMIQQRGFGMQLLYCTMHASAAHLRATPNPKRRAVLAGSTACHFDRLYAPGESARQQRKLHENAMFN